MSFYSKRTNGVRIMEYHIWLLFWIPFIIVLPIVILQVGNKQVMSIGFSVDSQNYI